MSDFFSSGWSVFIAAATIIGLLACLALLIIAARRRVMSGDNTTGHVWDEDIREMNNPLPRWWMYLFVITVVFAAIYLTFYPGLGSMKGTLDWSSDGQWKAEQEKAHAAMAPLYARYKDMSPADMAKDSEAMGIGERLFVNNCALCHGSDARGSKGFPNLTDADWMGGTGAEYIAKTVHDGRTGMMPPMAAAVGSGEDVKNVANYVLSLSGSPHNSVAAQLGKSKFGACAACHGASGQGNQALGAPNLADKVWLYGWGEEAVTRMIVSGKTNVMPAFSHRLTPEQIQVLSAYVWSLSQSSAVASAK